MPVRERKEVQEVLWRLKRVILTHESHIAARRFRTDRSTPRKPNLKKTAREDRIDRGGLHGGRVHVRADV